jgi:hypothetical protein
VEAVSPEHRQRAVAARWDGEAAAYDQQFDHRPRSPAERAAVGEWRRVLRPGGRVAVADGAWGAAAPGAGAGSPGLTGEAVRALLESQGYVGAGVDHLEDLSAALEARMAQEGRPVVRHPRYLVWGDVPP